MGVVSKEYYIGIQVRYPYIISAVPDVLERVQMTCGCRSVHDTIRDLCLFCGR